MKRDTVLFVSQKVKYSVNVLASLEEKLGYKLKGVLVVEHSNKSLISKLKEPELKSELKKGNFEVLILKNKNSQTVHAQLLPYLDKVLIATVHGESLIPTYKRILPHLPYVFGPTEKSLDWSTNKLNMRHMIAAFDKKLCPRFAAISDLEAGNLKKILKKIGFPLVAKPTGLDSSLLVSQCHYEEELESVLKKSFRVIKSIYKRKNGRDAPTMLVEQLMEGDMYTVDAYVNTSGRVAFCPLVYVETGRSAGFDDFFGYKRFTPTTKLSKASKERALAASKSGIKALGLRSATCHVELILSNNNWKIIEIAARMGGYRHDIYQESYGFDHGLNDLLNKLNKKPLINRRVLGHSCVMKIYAKNEGVIKQISGIKAIKALESVIKYNPLLVKGDKAYFAKHGGGGVSAVKLFNRNLSNLKADIRRVEQLILIKVSKK